MSLPEPLKTILNLDGFVIFIEGKKGRGKTNLSMLLNEICFSFKYRTTFATNIETQCYYMNYITNYPDLKKWLETTRGKKLYTLDEAGKHLKKMRFMSDQNTQIMDLIQLIRHYDCGFIGVAPSSHFVDSNFLNTDILDVRIKKLSLGNAKVIDEFNSDVYFLHSLPKTSIIHNSKDIAPFSMEKKIELSSARTCCQVAKFYAIDKNFSKVAKRFTPELHPEEVKRLLIEHIKHTPISQFTDNHEVKHSIEGNFPF